MSDSAERKKPSSSRKKSPTKKASTKTSASKKSPTKKSSLSKSSKPSNELSELELLELLDEFAPENSSSAAAKIIPSAEELAKRFPSPEKTPITTAVSFDPSKFKHIDDVLFTTMFRDTERLTFKLKCEIVNTFLHKIKEKVFFYNSKAYKTGTLNAIDRINTLCLSHDPKSFGKYIDELLEVLYNKVLFNNDTIGRTGKSLSAMYQIIWLDTLESRFGKAFYSGKEVTKGGMRKKVNRRRTRKI